MLPYGFMRYFQSSYYNNRKQIRGSFCEPTRGKTNQIRLQKSSETIVQNNTSADIIKTFRKVHISA